MFFCQQQEPPSGKSPGGELMFECMHHDEYCKSRPTLSHWAYVPKALEMFSQACTTDRPSDIQLNQRMCSLLTVMKSSFEEGLCFSS